MATIKKFEEIKAWQKARELNRTIGNYIDTGRFRRNFRLIDQIEGSAGSIMDNMLKVLREVAIRSFFNFFIFQKALAANSVHNFIGHWIGITLQKMNSMNYMNNPKKLL